MTNWEVTVVTESNYLKTVRVDNCNTRKDAEAAALGMTGGQRVVVSNPKTFYDEKSSSVSHSSSSSSEVDGAGVLGIGIILLIWIFWKLILAVGIIIGLIWLISWLLNREEY